MWSGNAFPSTIGSRGSSQGFPAGFGTCRPIGEVTWIGWAGVWIRCPEDWYGVTADDFRRTEVRG